MTDHHHSQDLGTTPWDVLTVLVLAAAAAGYAVALVASRRRSPWPTHRTALWYLGLACAAAALGPVASAARTSFTAHMLGHVLLGMLAPLLLVLAAPVTLLLRALPVDRARTVTGILRSPWARVVSHPVTASLLNAGGLWLLYTTELFHHAHASALLGLAVHAHVLLAGGLFTASLVGPDSRLHPVSLRVRAAVLVVFVATHSVLAKWLYAHPPPGVGTQDGRAGAQLMYYGGDMVDVTLMVLLAADWYRVTGRRSGVRAGSIVPTVGETTSRRGADRTEGATDDRARAPAPTGEAARRPRHRRIQRHRLRDRP
ncbi:cytochrome c oxidase assembly protein [Promicromonospora iranensis]|uniref:Membrane protein n=1 Tax=Promicromonospora iranensis TaxID=1105144 RepID=A0ABU2CUS4_9MICO|nr:cytochrome c oxidase assembly protein [Promicromonospora iranensis]MDR7385036.1 putative membrane protein [Promicromonospora iranensis]